jgi:phosphoglycerol transferase MdoB-like AlkP superfamily enzyme
MPAEVEFGQSRGKLSMVNFQFRIAFWAVGLLLLSDFLMRLVFLAYNAGSGWAFEGRDVPMSLLVGLRFDLATLAIFNGIVLILMVLPVRGMQRARKALNLILVILHLPVLLLNGIDVVYFGFAGKRLSHELFTGGKDLTNFGLVELLPYWWLALLVVGIAGLQFWLLNRGLIRNPIPQMVGLPSKFAAWSMPVLLAGLLFLAFRGGLQTRPMRPANAFVTGSLFLGNVSLNSAYTVAQSLEIGNEPDVELMPMAEAVRLSRALIRNDFDGPFESDEYPLLRKTNFQCPEHKYNVVLLIVESLNSAKVGCVKGLPPGQSLTPNLDSLAKHGRLYTNFYSNGARSVQSLPAIFNSTPDLFERPMIGSSFETNQHWGIGNMLLQRGYHTSFVCGGPNGTMGFDSFSKVCGFEHYFGRDDFPGDQTVASNWGAHDNGVLQWLSTLQNGFQKPFLNTWFSITNHHPFDLPADCPMEIAHSKESAMNKTVMYTDWALGQYFSRVRKSDWAENTIFAITGDHCFYFEDDPDRGDVQNYHVPLILLGPGISPGIDDRVGSHISILPTLIELLQLKTSYAGVGVSLLSKENDPFGITNVMGIMALSKKGHYLSSSLEQIQNCYSFQNGKWELDASLKTNAEGLSMHQSLKAIYQVCSYVRKNNKQNPSLMGS